MLLKLARKNGVGGGMNTKDLVYLRLGRLDVETVLDENYDFQIGIANTLKEGMM